jgi:hypothetical protein
MLSPAPSPEKLACASVLNSGAVARGRSMIPQGPSQDRHEATLPIPTAARRKPRFPEVRAPTRNARSLRCSPINSPTRATRAPSVTASREYQSEAIPATDPEGHVPRPKPPVIHSRRSGGPGGACGRVESGPVASLGGRCAASGGALKSARIASRAVARCKTNATTVHLGEGCYVRCRANALAKLQRNIHECAAQPRTINGSFDSFSVR